MSTFNNQNQGNSPKYQIPFGKNQSITNPSGENNGTQQAAGSSAPESAEGSGDSRQAPLTLPKGGGAIRGIGEKFQANPATGTASFSVPLAMAEGRAGFTPQLALSYDSGSGNSLFGLGWNVGIPSITRKTDKGIPQYNDHPVGESDTFILSGAEDLVPAVENGERAHRTEAGFDIYAYRPRTEGLFALIERWVDPQTHFSHWRTISKDNMTSVYGRSATARIADPENPQRIFSWLLEESRDTKGNLMQFTYKQEDKENIPNSCYEAQRLKNYSPPSGGPGGGFPNRYLKEVAYGNTEMYPSGSAPYTGDFHYRLVFDYGDHSPENPQRTGDQPWTARPDAFSNYRAGFEIRTYRICRRVLLFHHFPELGTQPVLVRSTDLDYQANPAFSLLQSVTHCGYDNGNKQTLPPLQFTYSEAVPGTAFKEVPPEQLKNLPAGVNGQTYQWTDLYSEGVSGILSLSTQAWYFKPNRGDGQFTDPEAGHVPGFDSMQKQVDKPGLIRGKKQSYHLGDVDADGFPELVLQGDQLNGYYSRDEEGNWSLFRNFEKYPRLDYQDANLRFMDLSGDGLQDMVISRGEHFDVYLSEGKQGFGNYRRIRCGNSGGSAPQILFSDAAQRIFLADMSGDGLADIVKIAHQSIEYWPNLGYGRFGQKITMSAAPLLDSREQFNPRYIYLADVDGTGTADLLYISKGNIRYFKNLSGNAWQEEALPAGLALANTPQMHIQPVDLLGNGTQCLVVTASLPGWENKMRYWELTSGIKPYLLTEIENNRGGSTKLHYAPSTKFYMQDKQKGTPWKTKLPFVVQTLEKVETLDLVDNKTFTQRYAYHHGYFDPVEREFRGFGLVEQWDTEGGTSPLGGIEEGEFFSPPVYTKTWFHTGYPRTSKGSLPERFAQEYWQGDTEAWHLPDTELPAGLTPAESREAYRALRGNPLRVEVYSLEEPDPLSTFNFQFSIPYTVEEKSYSLRCLQPQGKNKYAVFLKTEAESLFCHYECNADDPRIRHQLVLESDIWGNPLQTAEIAYPRRNATLPEQQTLLATCTQNRYINRTDAGCRLIGIPYQTGQYQLYHLPAAGGKLSVEQIRNAFQTAMEIDYAVDATGTNLQKRQIAEQRTNYWNAALDAPLPLGEIAAQALPYRKLSLELTQYLVDTIFNDGSNRVSPVMLTSDGRYLAENGRYFAPSPVVFYDAARFYLPVKEQDPFGNETLTDYDVHSLFPVKITDALGFETRAAYDYHTGQVRQLTDPNGNTRTVTFDPLGRITALILAGKNGEGDTLSDPTETYQTHDHQWMQNAQPTYTLTRKRETHADPNSRWLEAYTYTDGLGNAVLTKTTAEGGEAREWENGEVVTRTVALRWLASGKVVLNNKGKAIKQYEPWYATTPAFEAETKLTHYGVTPLMHYDPLGRLVQTDFPDGTTSKVEFTVWQQKNYDPNDCWEALGNTHYNTPQVLDFDVLGRPFQTTDDNGTDDQGNPVRYRTRHRLDISGRMVETFDALGRSATKNRYGFSEKHLLFTENIDSGKRWMLSNVLGNPIARWDSRGHCIQYKYDALQRPLETREGALLVEKTVYGEDAAANTIGQITEIYAQDGKTSFAYDFKGNILTLSKHFSKDYTANLNWDESILLDKLFVTQTAYDALNRPTAVTQPDGSVIAYRYDQGGMLQKVLHGSTEYIKNITYNARGQREAVYYGNNTRTAYTYHPENFRLTRLWTTRNAATETLQDLNYEYDAVGNIVEIRDAAEKTQYFNNQAVEALCSYEYDALYRLIKATGRELAALNAPNQDDFDNTIQVSAANAMQNYTHEYVYDALGNIRQQASQGKWTRDYCYQTNPSGIPVNNYLLKHSATQTQDDYTYDAHGNMLSMPHLSSMVWDYKDQLTSAGNGTFASYYQYDAQGTRTRKTVSKGNIVETRYYVNGYELYLKEVNGSAEPGRTTVNISDDEKVFVRIEQKAGENKVVRYQYDNHLGSACLELDENAALISYEEYHPFGTTSYRAGKGETEVSLKRYKYCGKERDEETGLYYYGMRYYAAWICRFVSVDPLQFKYPHYTPYQYAGNKPITYIDLDGLEEAKKDEKVSGNYYQYDEKKKGFRLIAGNNSEDSKNYVLKKGGNPEKFDMDNYELYPTDTQRNSIGKEWEKYSKDKESQMVGDGLGGFVKYIGTFYEISGFGTDSTPEVVSMGKGTPIYPEKIGVGVFIEAPNINKGDTVGNLNLVYHFHPTASVQMSYGPAPVERTAPPDFLFVQSPSDQDKINAGKYKSQMPNGGTVLQISKGDNVNFIDTFGVTLNIPIDVFRKPMKIIN